MRASGAESGRAVRLQGQEGLMVSIGEVQSEVVVEGKGQAAKTPPTEVKKEELREVVRELLEEMLEGYLRVEERR
jgi:hypothetical protein